MKKYWTQISKLIELEKQIDDFRKKVAKGLTISCLESVLPIINNRLDDVRREIAEAFAKMESKEEIDTKDIKGEKT